MIKGIDVDKLSFTRADGWHRIQPQYNEEWDDDDDSKEDAGLAEKTKGLSVEGK